MDETDLNALKSALKEFTRELKKSNDQAAAPNQNNPFSSPTTSGTSGVRGAAEFAKNQREKEEKAENASMERQRDFLEIMKLKNEGKTEELALLRDQLIAEKDVLKSQIDALKMKEQLSAEDEKKLKNLKIEYNELLKNKAATGMSLENLKEKNKELEKENRTKRVLRELDEERVTLAQESASIVSDTIDSLGKSTKLQVDPKRGVAGFLRAVVQDAGAREAALDAFKERVEKWKSLATKANLLGAAFEFVANALGSIVTLGFKGLIRVLQAVMEGIVGAVLLFDKLGASIAKSTGHGREFAQQYMDVAGALDDTGTTMAEQVEMMNELGSSLRGVGGMTIDTMGAFANLGITAKRLGMDIQDLTEITKFQTIGLGRSTEEVTQSISNLNAAAVTMGMDFSELSKQFVSTQGTFAAFGHRSEKVFLRTASMARQLGVELSDVVQLADKFKTFDSAANSVADLNYIMGGQFLDTMEMMQLRATEGPEGVARRIKENFDAMGQSFSDLSFHKQEALAEAAGMTMDKARNFFMGMADENETTAVERATQSFNEFAKRGRETMTIMTRIGDIAMSVAQQLAKAFGFDKFATGNIEELLTKFETFAKEDLVGNLVPIIRNDIMPFLKQIGTLLGNMANSRLLGADPTKNRVESQLNKMRTALGEEQFNRLVTEDARSTEEGAIDQNDRIQAQVKMIQQSNLANSKKAELLKEIMRLEKEISEDDNEFLTSASVTDEKFRKAVEMRHLGNQVPQEFTTALGIRTFGKSGVPEQALGGMTLSSGAVMVGEKGPEIVVLPTGATTIPNDAFARTGSPYNMDTTPSQRGQGETKVEVSINVDDRKLREVFSTTVEQVLVGA
tara:strand:+ start:2369 stop:4924 length:2556 start_codon:yes stop_codon:yes gene_type:complete